MKSVFSYFLLRITDVILFLNSQNMSGVKYWVPSLFWKQRPSPQADMLTNSHTDSKLKTWSTFFACHGHHSWGDSARRRAWKCGCCSIGLRLRIRSKVFHQVLGLRENEECGWGLWESLTLRYHSLPPLSPADILAGLLMHFRVIFCSGGTWRRSGFNHNHAEFESPFKFAVFFSFKLNAMTVMTLE